MSVSKPDGDHDGVVNPGGFAVAGAGPLFLALMPVTSYITQQGGVFEKIVDTLVNTIGFIGTAGAQTTIAPGRSIPALGALYLFLTYAMTGAVAVGARASATPKGHDNNHPRTAFNNLTGLPLRLHSAHQHLIETFPGWALAAGLTMTLAPGNKQLINLLGFHVIAKCFVFYPAYAFNIAPLRSVCHLTATASIINVAWKLASGAM